MLKLLDREVDGKDVIELYRYEDGEYIELYLRHMMEDGGYIVRALSLHGSTYKVEYYIVVVGRGASDKWLAGEKELMPDTFGIWVEHVRSIKNIDEFEDFLERYFP